LSYFDFAKVGLDFVVALGSPGYIVDIGELWRGLVVGVWSVEWNDEGTYSVDV
jgi:hypothetical protein